MKLAFHGATTMTSDIETDVAVSARAGFSALEVWTAKLDRYLAEHSLDDLASLAPDYDSERLTARFVVLRRDRFLVRETQGA